MNKSIARFTIMPNGLIVGVADVSKDIKPGYVYEVNEDYISKHVGGDCLKIIELGVSDFINTEPTSADAFIVKAEGKHLTVNGK